MTNGEKKLSGIKKKNLKINRGEVWYVNYPLEEDITKTLPRPVVVIDETNLKVLSVKVTKHDPREWDNYDTPIVYWQQAKLRFKSTARVAKTLLLDKNMFMHKMGDLHPDDLKDIEDKLMQWFSEKQ